MAGGSITLASSANVTITPMSVTGSGTLVTVTGTPSGTGQIQATSNDGSVLFTNLMVSVKERISKTVAIHAITEQNDDVQAIAVGQGQPGQICISPGPNGVLNTTAALGDVRVGNNITTGADGICQTTKAGDDSQVIPVNQGKPNVACVTAGANGFRDTVPVGNDGTVSNFITTGSDGICQTAANNINLVPSSVPSSANLQAYLSDIWGKQANVYFTVYRSDATVHYDLDWDGVLDQGGEYFSTEEQKIRNAARDATKDINVYYVNVVSSPNANTLNAETFIQDSHANSAVNITAHEIGHALGRQGDSDDSIDVMLWYSSSANPCNVKKVDWDAVNNQ
jgi:hypothetical protein